jgi:hypothetical protein
MLLTPKGGTDATFGRDHKATKNAFRTNLRLQLYTAPLGSGAEFTYIGNYSINKVKLS